MIFFFHIAMSDASSSSRAAADHLGQSSSTESIPLYTLSAGLLCYILLCMMCLLYHRHGTTPSRTLRQVRQSWADALWRLSQSHTLGLSCLTRWYTHVSLDDTPCHAMIAACLPCLAMYIHTMPGCHASCTTTLPLLTYYLCPLPPHYVCFVTYVKR